MKSKHLRNAAPRSLQTQPLSFHSSAELPNRCKGRTPSDTKNKVCTGTDPPLAILTPLAVVLTPMNFNRVQGKEHCKNETTVWAGGASASCLTCWNHSAFRRGNRWVLIILHCKPLLKGRRCSLTLQRITISTLPFLSQTLDSSHSEFPSTNARHSLEEDDKSANVLELHWGCCDVHPQVPHCRSEDFITIWAIPLKNNIFYFSLLS